MFFSRVYVKENRFSFDFKSRVKIVISGMKLVFGENYHAWFNLKLESFLFVLSDSIAN